MSKENESIFHKLHLNSTPLILPNAWDVGSARLIENLGAPAVATTSAGVAWSLGYGDGRELPVEQALAAAARIVRAVKVPVSFDIENGYADDPQQVASTVLRLAQIGVAGINIEDGSDTPELLSAKINAIRKALAAAGASLFINARTDVILAGLVEPALQLEETIKRGKLYAAAGADGLFVPGLRHPGDIKAVVAAVPLPLSLMAWGGLADAAGLAKLGVRRLSAGSAIAQAAWGAAEGLITNFLESGASEPLFADSKPFGELQKLFRGA